MVTIKIQSREDIIAAYLKSFGFCDDKLAAVVSAVTGNLQKVRCGSGEELLAFVDGFLLKTARKIFMNSRLDDEQLLAQFKLCFILCRGAEKCTSYGLKSFKLPSELTAQMRACAVTNAPPCKYTEMTPQKIEPIHSGRKKK